MAEILTLPLRGCPATQQRKLDFSRFSLQRLLLDPQPSPLPCSVCSMFSLSSLSLLSFFSLYPPFHLSLSPSPRLSSSSHLFPSISTSPWSRMAVCTESGSAQGFCLLKGRFSLTLSPILMAFSLWSFALVAVSLFECVKFLEWGDGECRSEDRLVNRKLHLSA